LCCIPAAVYPVLDIELGQALKSHIAKFGKHFWNGQGKPGPEARTKLNSLINRKEVEFN
jgi:hypothetical protein